MQALRVGQKCPLCGSVRRKNIPNDWVRYKGSKILIPKTALASKN